MLATEQPASSASYKSDPGHADYKGVLQLTGSKASVLIWVHSDGSLGLRLEKINDGRKSQLGGRGA